MPTSPFTNRPTVLSLPLLFIFILSLFVSTSTAYSCQCACCFGNFCALSIIGTDSVTSCNSCTDDFCTSEYPASCPTNGASGDREATCSSSTGGGGGLAIWVIILIAVGALGAVVVAGVIIALVIMSQRTNHYQQI